uniref:Uncharacterized protein n=1 Tax=Rhizophagus irregularis (strain DAOM 181602 / DAOM 197198 / MUCL 43194) TaxID=747089 RepID=U9UE44_RHIID
MVKARGKYGEAVEFDSGRIWVALYPAITTSAVYGANCFTETSVLKTINLCVLVVITHLERRIYCLIGSIICSTYDTE